MKQCKQVCFSPQIIYNDLNQLTFGTKCFQVTAQLQGKHRKNTLAEMQSDEGERTHINISKHQLQTLPSIQNQLQLCRGNKSVESEKGMWKGMNWMSELIGAKRRSLGRLNFIQYFSIANNFPSYRRCKIQKTQKNTTHFLKNHP